MPPPDASLDVLLEISAIEHLRLGTTTEVGHDALETRG